MSFSRLALVPVLALAVAGLAGCTFTASLTVPASSVAKVTADALEKQVGTRPEVDCGDDSVKLIDGTKVDCDLTDPSSGHVYDTAVTISDVKGTHYSVDVKVADTPKP